MKQINLFKTVSTIIGFGVVGWLSLFRPDWILIYGYFISIPGYLLLLFLLTPIGSLKFGTDVPRLTKAQWFSKLLLAQFALFFLSVAAGFAFFAQGPEFSHDRINIETVILTLKNEYVWWGLFPWGLIGFWGFIIAYIAFVKKGAPFYYQIARGFCPRFLEPMVKTYVEGTITGATVLVISLISVSIITLITVAFENYKGGYINHFLVPVVTFSIISFFAPLAIIPFFRKRYQRWVRKVSLSQIVALAMFIFVPILIFSAYANKYMVTRHPELYNAVCVQCQQMLSNIPYEYRFAALFWSWWLIWTPFAGSYLASISQGRTLREYVLGLYALPLVLIIYFYNSGIGHVLAFADRFKNLLVALFSQHAITVFYMMLALISSWILLHLLRGYRDTTVFYVGPMPVENCAKGRNRLHQASKITGIGRDANKIFMTIIGTLFLGTISGWIGIQIQLVAFATLVVNAVYIGAELLLLHLFRDRIWIGNQNIQKFE